MKVINEIKFNNVTVSFLQCKLLYACMHTHTHTHTHMHACKHTHTHTGMQVHTHTHTTTTIIQVIRPTSSHPNIAIRTTTPMKSVTMINGVRNPHTGHKPFRRLKQNRFIRKLPESKNIYLSVTLKCAQEFVLVTFHSLQCVNKWTQ